MMIRDRILTPEQVLKLRMTQYSNPGEKFERPVKTHDGKFVDSSGAFLNGELERFDATEHPPLMSVTWDRDLPLRDDVSLGDEVSSFTQSTFATPSGAGTGSATGQKRSFTGKKSTQIPEMEVDIDKSTVPLMPWGLGIEYSLAELESSLQAGRPIDKTKLDALEREYQLQVDAQAYLGWEENDTYGLINSPLVNLSNLANGASGYPQWPRKTNTEILSDLQQMVYAPWAASGFAVYPNRILLDPLNLALIRVIPATEASSESILEYFLRSVNQRADTRIGGPLEVHEVKWLTGSGEGGTLLQPNSVNRAVVYTRHEGPWQEAPVRFPLTMLSRTPVQFDGLFHKFYKWGRVGACEFVYPETVAYYDGN